VIDPEFANGDATNADVRVTILKQPALQARVDWLAPDGIDLALLSVPVVAEHIEAAPWDPETTARVGDTVFAVGNPHELGWTHTQGTISQFRVQHAADKTVRVIQVDLAVNSGNSGGGLYAQDGSLIGINTWSNDKRVSEGLAFAISFASLWAILPPHIQARLEAGGSQHE
jgi:S1-C subfamily serine protease